MPARTMAISNSQRKFPLAPLQPWVWAVPFALWAALLLLAFVTGSHEQSPHNPVPWWLVVVFGTALLPAGLVSGLAHRDIGIKGNALEVSGGLFFVRQVPVNELALDQARILALDEHTELKPLLQLFGFSPPGFNVGHYLLRNRSRAFCLLTSRQRVLYLPLRNGKPALLLSPEHPQALLDAVRQAQTQTQTQG